MERGSALPGRHRLASGFRHESGERRLAGGRGACQLAAVAVQRVEAEVDPERGR